MNQKYKNQWRKKKSQQLFTKNKNPVYTYLQQIASKHSEHLCLHFLTSSLIGAFLSL